MDKAKNQFLIYTTANESDYSVDYRNIVAMTRYIPGCGLVKLYVVISLVEPLGTKDQIFKSLIDDLIRHCKWLKLERVLYKDNIGRDFSSARDGLKAVREVASDDDEIMIRNRSAYGPFQDNWFKAYSDLFNSHTELGLTGNTINLMGHPKRKTEKETDQYHIQTYLYLSNYRILKNIIDKFPGVNETNRLELIDNGEIELSRLIVNQGCLINCLHWPIVLFGEKISLDENLPRKDVRYKKLGLPFEHRHGKRFYHNIFVRIGWRLRILKWKLIAKNG